MLSKKVGEAMLEHHQIELLKTLSNLVGVSGHEETILQFISEQLPFCMKEQDKLGSGLFSLGEGDLSIMFATHMDEVGFIVSSINERGYVSIQPVGNMWAHTLLQQLVTITTSDGRQWTGIIGGPQTHAISPEARKKVVAMEELFIDLGVDSRESIQEMGIEVGDVVSLVSTCQTIGLNQDYMIGKALDNRVSVALGIWLMQALEHQHISKRVTLATTIQEEVGLRGARTTAFQEKPLVAFAVDTTLAGDTPANQNYTKLGKGVSLTAIDNMTVTNRGLLIYLENLCKKHQIPYQIGCFTKGGTDAGNIYKSETGILATTLSIPIRYMHTHQSIVHLGDVEATLRLMCAICEDLTMEKYHQILEYNYQYGMEE